MSEGAGAGEPARIPRGAGFHFRGFILPGRSAVKFHLSESIICQIIQFCRTKRVKVEKCNLKHAKRKKTSSPAIHVRPIFSSSLSLHQSRSVCSDDKEEGMQAFTPPSWGSWKASLESEPTLA